MTTQSQLRVYHSLYSQGEMYILLWKHYIFYVKTIKYTPKWKVTCNSTTPKNISSYFSVYAYINFSYLIPKSEVNEFLI